MATQIGELGVTFPDDTVQTTAAIAGAPGFGGFTRMSVYTTTSFWTVPAGVTTCKVTVVGGGGGGSGHYPDLPGITPGGGGGGTAIKIISGLIPGNIISVTVGTGGIPGNQTNGLPGTPGGTSSFGAYVSATGGAGTQYFENGGGAGGIGVSGTLNLQGGQGMSSTTDAFSGGTFLSPPGGTSYGNGSVGGMNSLGVGYPGQAGVVIVEY